ncbi:MAG: sigma factor regulator [Bacilli bacterium]|nr:sigma factor regulator [Bacilli bacterium]
MKDDNKNEERVLTGLDESNVRWDGKQARRLIWRTRLALLRTTVLTVIGIYFLYSIYSSIIQGYYLSSSKSQEFVRSVTTYVETHENGLRVDSSLIAQATMSPWFEQSVQLKLYEYVGNWQVVVGDAVASQSPLVPFHVAVNLNQQFLNQNQNFTFALPNDLYSASTSDLSVQADSDVWNQLRHIGDGNVAIMAFSTKKGKTPEALRQILTQYDLHILSMPVYSGELNTFKISSMTAGSTYFVNHLMLRPFTEYMGSGSASTAALNSAADLSRSEKDLTQDVEWLIANGHDPDMSDDQKRVAYLKSHGIQVYGAVVTGPVRELEKLQKESDFDDFQLGQVEVWNWK